jgi:FAD/FMN-containing dehydrogenase
VTVATLEAECAGAATVAPTPAPAAAVRQSWGRGPHGTARQTVFTPRTLDEARTAYVAAAKIGVIAYGCGRSYGDVALNPGRALVDCSRLDRFVAFDRTTGRLVCEAGVRLADILATVCATGDANSAWFLPVSPGTRFVTIGGAVANDVHGKNHHRQGCFGRHVMALDLARSDGRVLSCSPQTNADLFRATIGGLGLTGLILRVTLQLRRVPGTAVEMEEIRFDTLDDFFALSEASDGEWEYTAAWIDCVARGRATGRGLFNRARHLPGRMAPPPALEPTRNVSLEPPLSFVNRLSLKPFNALYWRKLGLRRRVHKETSYEPIFYPLDAIGHWNRLYGPKGFFQFQSVVPHAVARGAVAAMLEAIEHAGEGSMLAVLKKFGDVPSPGLLSFPMPGSSLALDFPDRGASTRALLQRLEAIAIEAGGRIYPAKDSQMSATAFRVGYPDLEAFRAAIDPGATSGFARRLGLLEPEERR